MTFTLTKEILFELSVSMSKFSIHFRYKQLEIIVQILNCIFEIVICFGAGWIEFLRLHAFCLKFLLAIVNS